MTEAVRRWSAYAVPALPLAATGWILAAIFFGTALTPSLMPRDPLTQGFLAGSAAMIGYGIGHIAIGVWRFLEIPRIDLRWRDQARRGAYAAALLIVLACLWRAAV
ncbi:MAG: alpha/beta-hydrolase N-terminal domain-containing protein, partial [Hyphomicrobiaceae bacterium]